MVNQIAFSSAAPSTSVVPPKEDQDVHARSLSTTTVPSGLDDEGWEVLTENDTFNNKPSSKPVTQTAVPYDKWRDPVYLENFMYERLRQQGETRPVQDVFVHKTPRQELWQDETMWTEKPVRIHNDLRSNQNEATKAYPQAGTSFKNLQDLSKILQKMREDKFGKPADPSDFEGIQDIIAVERNPELKKGPSELEKAKIAVGHFIDKSPPLFIEWLNKPFK